ncbi:hypothetical protein BZA77DRAFT_306542 [Pyronema omphalodes]|nr:hypothetical protein BZA77DRAFT_306542 [Pyronema omphalodes]
MATSQRVNYVVRESESQSKKVSNSATQQLSNSATQQLSNSATQQLSNSATQQLSKRPSNHPHATCHVLIPSPAQPSPDRS